MLLHELSDTILCQMLEEVQNSQHLSIAERVSLVKGIAEAAQLFSETESNRVLAEDILKCEHEAISEDDLADIVDDEDAPDDIVESEPEAEVVVSDDSDDIADYDDEPADVDDTLDYADEDLELDPLPQNAEQDWDVFGAARDVIEYGVAGEFVDERDE